MWRPQMMHAFDELIAAQPAQPAGPDQNRRVVALPGLVEIYPRGGAREAVVTRPA
jgi:hypothetical protein